jgi:hypothetical protein
VKTAVRIIAGRTHERLHVRQRSLVSASRRLIDGSGQGAWWGTRPDVPRARLEGSTTENAFERLTPSSLCTIRADVFVHKGWTGTRQGSGGGGRKVSTRLCTAALARGRPALRGRSEKSGLPNFINTCSKPTPAPQFTLQDTIGSYSRATHHHWRQR